MRVLIGLLLIAAALAGYSWWQSWDAGEARARHERAAAMQRAESSLIRFLDGEERLDVRNLVVSGTAPGGSWEFRGLVTRQERRVPVFGVAERDCDRAEEDKASGGAADGDDACWTIVSLEIDGEALPVDDLDAPGPTGAEVPTTAPLPETGEPRGTAEDAGTVDATAPAAAPEAPEAVGEPAEGEAPARDGAGAPGAAEAPTEDPDGEEIAAAPAPLTTHRVARPVVNARAGPGTGNDVLTTLEEGTRLALREERDGWGRFLILDGVAAEIEAWVALSIVEPVPAGTGQTAPDG